jgi:diadenylate cyclase
MMMDFFATINPLIDIFDVIFVAILLYYFFLLIRGTRAVQILQGVGVLLLLLLGSYYLRLQTIYWILHYSLYAIVVALPIVFQPELRRTLGFIGRGGGLKTAFEKVNREDLTRTVDEIVWSAALLSQTRMGAIMVLEKETGLREFVETGTRVNGEVSSKLLLSIFFPKSPLHDGAVIVKGNKVVAASCYLPLSENVGTSQGKSYGTRHRAALGLTEQTDAIVVVVSEETGNISVARNGKFTKNLTEETLKKVLMTLYPGEVSVMKKKPVRKLAVVGGKSGIYGLFKKQSGS